MGVEFEFIAYDSGAPMLTALAAGEVDMCIVNPAEAAPLVSAGKIVPLAVMSDERLDSYADTPTCKEAGIDVTYAVWRGVFTKAGTSEEIPTMRPFPSGTGTTRNLPGLLTMRSPSTGSS